MDKYSKYLVIILLATVFFIPFFSALNFSIASDEITHLPSGYSYWKTGLIELNPQHPPLVKLIASFPMLFMDIKFDRYDPSLVGPFQDEWKFGQNLIFSNDADKLLFWGRIPIMILSLLLGSYIFKWGLEMFGPKGGLLALFVYTFMPAIAANAMFVTTDMAITSFSFVTLYYLWKFFESNKAKYLIYVGLFLGFALASKFSAVLLFPIIILLTLVHLYFQEKTLESKINQAVKMFLVILVTSFAVVYTAYLFPLDASFYLKGIRTVYADWGENYRFYLNGNFSSDGWWYYFLFAFLIKTPVPMLIGLLLSVAMYKRYPILLKDKAFIFIPVIIFFVVTSVRAGNISIRYLLPVYPFLMLYVGGLAEMLTIDFSAVKNKLKSCFLIVLGGWYIISFIAIYPDYLAYFNELVGGPVNGHRYLDDSNLEWGQDIKRLTEYQKQHPDTKVLYSWSYSNPAYYGVKNILPKEPTSLVNPSGRYAINAHFLVRLKDLSQRFNNKDIDWLSLYQPTDRIGYSFFIYDLP